MLLMDPALLLGLMDHVTAAAPPVFSMAVNCSSAEPELDALQPVQLVSMDAVPGETEKVLLVELLAEAPPPQPATRARTGRPANASRRADHRVITWADNARPREIAVCRRFTVMTTVLFKTAGAFLAEPITHLLFNNPVDPLASAGAYTGGIRFPAMQY